jgi:molecular chaperone HtpG
MALETHSFQAEVKQLLQLMIHSLYSNKEIFLRELISNASDAIDKVRFEQVTKHDLVANSKSAGIRISSFPDSKRLVIEDTGIGMTRDELMTHLGTIAHSGTKKFLEQLAEGDKNSANLIGQFGVGFYSAFMVADRITVTTRSAQKDSVACRWESSGDGSFTIDEIPNAAEMDRGTRIELQIKESEKEFLDDWRIKAIIKKYSNYVTYPIFFIDKENKEEQVNTTVPVWARSKADNKDEDYHELYKQISYDFREPLLYEHLKAEGHLSFDAVVFVPQEPPFDLYQRDKHGLHLYTKRVSIDDKCKDLIPEYLRFVSGVVETDDLPLNVSREILQQNNRIPAIRKQIVKKILGTLSKLSNDDNKKYMDFYEKFGAVLKEGFHFDQDSHDKLSELVRFHSTKSGKENWITLEEYVKDFAPGQKDIYYITGSSIDAVSRSPHLEAFRARGVDVLFLTDAIDEWVVMSFTKFKDHELKSIAKGQIDLSGIGTEPAEDEKKSSAISQEEIAPLLDLFRKQLDGVIKDVKVSHRLTESPVCLVAEENAMSAQLEQLMKVSNKDFQGSRKILEVNTSHPLIKNLRSLQQREGGDAKMSDWIEILYNTALLAEGSPIQDPGTFARRVTKVMEEASL